MTGHEEQEKARACAIAFVGCCLFMNEVFPSMLCVRQRLETALPLNVEAAISEGFEAIRPQLKPGMRVALGVGSRGISNLSEIVLLVVKELKSAGTNPFIIPAMGSHGGATAEGQVALLAGYGVTEARMGVPIRPSMEVKQLGKSAAGRDVLWSQEAAAADGVLVINRVKPHTDFSGKIGSGLMKMLVVGLGKHAGAASYHAGALTIGYEQSLIDLTKVVLTKVPVLGGIAIVEDATHELAHLEVVPVGSILIREPELCEMARSLMPTLPFDEIDLLIVDQIGKNISGTGMDTNIIGRGVHGFQLTPELSESKPFIWRIFVRDLTSETHGNAIGIGMAEATTQRLIEKIDTEALQTNVITARSVQCAKQPMAFATDAEAIKAMLESLPDPNPAKARVVRIKDTLTLSGFEISAALEQTAIAHPAIVSIDQVGQMDFGQDGNLKSITQG